jgi:hypothetical protein
MYVTSNNKFSHTGFTFYAFVIPPDPELIGPVKPPSGDLHLDLSFEKAPTTNLSLMIYSVTRRGFSFDAAGNMKI